MKDLREMIADFRRDVPEPGASKVEAAREEFLRRVEQPDGPRWLPRRRRYWLVAPAIGAAVAAVAILVVSASGPTVIDATATDVSGMAAIAARQERLVTTLAPGQYVLSESSTTAIIELTLTQAKIDRLVNSTRRAERSGGFERQFFDQESRARAERARETQRRRRERRGRTPRLEQLPTASIELTRRNNSASWFDETHRGGASDLPDARIGYGSGDQADAAEILRGAGVPDGVAELKKVTLDQRGSQLSGFTWPSAELRRLSTDPDRLREQLLGKPLPSPLAGGGSLVRDEAALFHVGISLLRSAFASPQLRAATVRMIGALEGVESDRDARDARQRIGLGLTLTGSPIESQVVLDAGNSRVLGVNYSIERPSRLARRDLITLPLADHASLGVAFEPAIVVQGEPVCRDARANDASEVRFCPSQVRPVG